MSTEALRYSYSILSQRFTALETPAPQSFAFSSSVPKTAVSNSTTLTTPNPSATKPAAVLGKKFLHQLLNYYAFYNSVFLSFFTWVIIWSFHNLIASVAACVAAPVRPVQTSTPSLLVQKPAPTAQGCSQPPQVLSGFNTKLLGVQAVIQQVKQTSDSHNPWTDLKGGKKFRIEQLYQ